MQKDHVSRIFNFAMEQISEGTEWGLSLNQAITETHYPKVLELLHSGLPESFGVLDKLVVDMAAEQLLGGPVYNRKVKTPPNRSSLDKARVRKVMREVMSSHLSDK